MKYFFLTLALAYLINMGCTTPQAAPPATDTALPAIRCNRHPLPEFTLGSDRSSGEAEQAAVCECIWSRLSEQDRQVAANLYDGLANKSSVLKSFSIHFGEAIGACTLAAS